MNQHQWWKYRMNQHHWCYNMLKSRSLSDNIWINLVLQVLAPNKAMDLVEEFLELGRKVFWLAVVSFDESILHEWTYHIDEYLRLVFLLWWHSLRSSNGDFHEDSFRIYGSIYSSTSHMVWFSLCPTYYNNGEIPILCSMRPNLLDLLRMEHKDNDRNAPRNFWRWVDRQHWRKMLPKPRGCFISISVSMPGSSHQQPIIAPVFDMHSSAA